MKKLSTLLALAAAVSALVASTIPSTSSGASTKATTVALGHSQLGRILVDGAGRTLYLFEKDRHGRSACTGACASYWPPLLATAKPAAGRGVKGSLLGVTRRTDGTRQVTYAGHPLYRFALDTKPGQVNGQDLHDFGAGWYVVSAAGKKVEKGD